MKYTNNSKSRFTTDSERNFVFFLNFAHTSEHANLSTCQKPKNQKSVKFAFAII